MIGDTPEPTAKGNTVTVSAGGARRSRQIIKGNSLLYSGVVANQNFASISTFGLDLRCNKWNTNASTSTANNDARGDCYAHLLSEVCVKAKLPPFSLACFLRGPR